MNGKSYTVMPGWAILMKDIGLNPPDVLKIAGLPLDTLVNDSSLNSVQMYALWNAMDGLYTGPALPVAICQAISVEAFDPVLFAATCSPNLLTAARRLAQHKPLIGPLTLDIDDSGSFVTFSMNFPDSPPPPQVMSLTELGFWVQLATICTRNKARAHTVTSPTLPANQEPFAEYFGTEITESSKHSITFSRADATRPFLTVNDAMWEFFEPELRRRLAELEPHSSTVERVKACLLEQLPAGSGTVDSVARELAISSRTLQRRLKAEGTAFQLVLDDTRESLARHYLAASDLPTHEISFLLGYNDIRSFYRAFQQWTGHTPSAARISEQRNKHIATSRDIASSNLGAV